MAITWRRSECHVSASNHAAF